MIGGTTLGAVLIMGAVSMCVADVHRVPVEFATIQGALDAVHDGDTILVSLGTYAEELQAPPRRFWLMGDVEVDTGNFPRPTVDPSTLDSARWRRCLNIPQGCELTIERMAFQNHAPMYPREDSLNWSGIMTVTRQPLTLRHCAFDSIWGGVVHWWPTDEGDYLIEDCRFSHATRVQVFCRGQAEVRRCDFQADRAACVYGREQTSVEDCRFSGPVVSHAIMTQESGPLIRNCVFGPIDSAVAPVIRIENDRQTTIQENVFRDIGIGDPEDFEDLIDLTRMDSALIAVRMNFFADIRSVGSAGGTGLMLRRSDPAPPDLTAQIDDNVFLNYTSSPSPDNRGKALSIHAVASLMRNRFWGVQPDTLPDIAASVMNLSDVPWRHNLFEAGDYAIRTMGVFDARWNWWGDASGPYNANLNPNGLGARVDDGAQFDPWCPDTSCSLSVPGLGAPLPDQFVFETYPNPFNSILHLTLIPAHISIVKLELFDRLGRRVDEIWHGPLAYQKDINFDASALASGIYFARVTDAIDRHTLAVDKVVLLK